MLAAINAGALDAVVRHFLDIDGRHPAMRRVACTETDPDRPYAVARRLFPELDIGPEATTESTQRSYQQVTAHIGRLLAEAPLVLALEAAHHCDEGTLRLLDYVLRRMADRPLTVLMALASEPSGPAGRRLNDIAARSNCTVIDLTVASLASIGWVGDADLERLLHHQPWLRDVVTAVAILRTTDVDLVGALARLPPRLTAAAITTVRDAGAIIEPIPPPGVPHPLDTVLVGRPAEVVERLRRQAAGLLNDAGRPAEQIADQLMFCGRPDEPWMWDILREAAQEAARHSALDAVRYLSRLQQVDPDQVTVLIDLASALLDLDPVSALTHLRTALPHASDTRTRARLIAKLALAAVMARQSAGVAALLHDARFALRAECDARPTPADRELTAMLEATAALLPAPAGQAHAAAADAAGTGGPPTGGGAPPASATGAGAPRWAALPAALDGLAGSPEEGHIQAVRALRAALSGRALGTAIDCAHRALRTATPAGSWAVVTAASVLALADETTHALERLRRAAADSRRRRHHWAECQARSVASFLLVETGALTDAETEARTALKLARRCGWPARTPLPLITIALGLLAQGQAAPAEAALAAAAQELEDAAWERPHLLLAQALVHRQAGDLAAALTQLESCGNSLAAAGIDNPVLAPWWLGQTELLVRLERVREATERAEYGAALSAHWPTPRSIGLSLLARGTVASGGRQVELLAEAAQSLAGSPDRLHHARAELRLGRVLLERDDRSKARAHLRTALSLSRRHGFTVLADRARHRLTLAGGRARPADATDAEVLTSSERAVAELAASGETNRRIAEALYITVRTVEFHLTNVYRKLGVSRRSELAERMAAGAGAGRSQAEVA